MQTPSASAPPAAASTDPGFKLPSASAPADAAAAKPAAGAARADAAQPADAVQPAAVGGAAGAASIEVAPVAGAPATDTSTRDMAVGGAAFLVLLVVYFFVRNAYVHHMVVRRVAPSAAGSAGWLLFVGLAFMSAAAVLGVVNASRYLTFAITAPLVLIGLVALVAALFVGRR